MVGSDGRTPTERLRGRGVQRPVYELGEKVLFLPLAPARQGDFGARFRLWDLPRLQIIRWPGVHWNTLRTDQMQDSATVQCSAMGHRIRAEHQRTPDGERAGHIGIRVDLPEARGDRGVHPPEKDPPIIPRRMRLTREMFERFGLTVQ